MSRAVVILAGLTATAVLAGVGLVFFDDGRFVLGLVLLGLAGTVVAVVYQTVEEQRRTSLRGRVQSFVGTREDYDELVRERTAPAPPPTPRERAVDLIAPEADIAGLEPRLGHILAATATVALLMGVAVAVLVSSPWGLLAALAAPFITRFVVKRRVRRTRKLFEQQLPDNLDVVTSALRVGHSIPSALAVTVEAADEPSRSELGRAVADEQLGVPVDIALLRVAERMQSRDIEQVAFVARLQRDAGTNAAEVIDQVSENVRGRMDLERLVRTLTAQGRMARWIVSLLPVFLFCAMYVLNKEYLAPLWETPLGKAGMALAFVMVVTGSFVIKKIVEIEV